MGMVSASPDGRCRHGPSELQAVIGFTLNRETTFPRQRFQQNGCICWKTCLYSLICKCVMKGAGRLPVPRWDPLSSGTCNLGPL